LSHRLCAKTVPPEMFEAGQHSVEFFNTMDIETLAVV